MTDGIMTVKDRVGRQRYIGFILDARERPGREEFLRSLAEAARSFEGLPAGKLQLTVYDGGKGILKVPHTCAREAVALLGSIEAAGRQRMPVRIRTVLTSGTIQHVKKKLGLPHLRSRVLRRRGAKSRAPPG